jgi:hypothetical protein
VNMTVGSLFLVRITSNTHLLWACVRLFTPSNPSHFQLSHTFRIFHTSNPLEPPDLLHLHSSHTTDPLTLLNLLHSSTSRPLSCFSITVLPQQQHSSQHTRLTIHHLGSFLKIVVSFAVPGNHSTYPKMYVVPFLLLQ